MKAKKAKAEDGPPAAVEHYGIVENVLVAPQGWTRASLQALPRAHPLTEVLYLGEQALGTDCFALAGIAGLCPNLCQPAVASEYRCPYEAEQCEEGRSNVRRERLAKGAKRMIPSASLT